MLIWSRQQRDETRDVQKVSIFWPFRGRLACTSAINDGRLSYSSLTEKQSSSIHTLKNHTMSATIVPHNRTVVLSTYRNLLRATRIAFQGTHPSPPPSTTTVKLLTQTKQATTAHYKTPADSHETHSTRTVASKPAVSRQTKPSNTHKEWLRSSGKM